MQSFPSEAPFADSRRLTGHNRFFDGAGAVLGDEVEIPTITGETVALKIPGGTQPGEKLRVAKHGLPRPDGYGRGSLIVQIQIDVPKNITAEQQELLRRFDELEDGRRKKGTKKTIFEKVKDIFS